MDIQESIKKVISYAKHIENPKINDLYTKWEINKHRFKTKLGNCLIYETPQEVTFTLSDKEKLQNFKMFINDTLYDYNTNISLFLDQILVEDFFENRTSQQYEIKIHDTPVIVPKGAKILKAFKLFEPNQDIVKTLQQKASSIIQLNNLTGHLCISIHPLDYLSISENTLGWRSCHSLDGEYASGNLEYMADSSTVVCYLKSNKNAILPNFPEDVLWNNKKWRCLLFFDKNFEFVMAGRQYPFESKDGMQQVRQLLNDCGFGIWTQWYNDYIDSTESRHFFFDSVLPIGRGLVPIDEVVSVLPRHLFYCDLLDSSFYSYPYYAYNITDSNPFCATGWTQIGKTKINIGERVLCPSCQKNVIDEPSTMLCNQCGLSMNRKNYCDLCGRKTNNLYYIDDEVMICENCYTQATRICGRCGNRVITSRGSYNAIHKTFICNRCKEEMEESI